MNINDNFTKSFNNDEDYDKLLHPKNKSKAKIIKIDNNKKSKQSKSAYSMSIRNIIDNLDTKKDNNNITNNNIIINNKNLINYNQYYDYDDLINNINNQQKGRYSRIDKKGSIKKSISSNGKFDYSSISNSNDNISKSYVLAPMASLPITNISFRARLKYYSNKREKELKRMLDKKNEEEKQIYTFQPKTGENKLNVIKYNNNNIMNELNLTQEYDSNKRKKVDIQRIHNLYLDYKEKKNKREKLAEEYYKKAGFSFSPYIKDNNKEIIKFKKKIAQMPYLDRIEIYNHNRLLNKIRNINPYYMTEDINY